MQYTRLGSSGLRVSRIALGTMGFGDGSRETWALGYDEAEAFFRQALDLGITFWDTANIYSFGASESIVGQALKNLTRRDEIVLATKVNFPMGEGPGESGLSRKAILQQLDASLTRLGTDYVDLYQIHRWDPEVPVEETMEALHDVIKAGKVRYVGASSMFAWQFSKLQHAADLNGWTRFISMQDQYNLVQRGEEAEMFPLLADQGVGSIPWGPLARGVVARPWGPVDTRRGSDLPTVDDKGNPLVRDSDKAIVDAVERIAADRGVSMASVALAWVLRNPVVDAPIVGASKPHHLSDAVGALEIELTDDEVRALEEPYTFRPPTYF